MKCPECNGIGAVEEITQWWIFSSTMYIMCKNCCGTGEIR